MTSGIFYHGVANVFYREVFALFSSQQTVQTLMRELITFVCSTQPSSHHLSKYPLDINTLKSREEVK